MQPLISVLLSSVDASAASVLACASKLRQVKLSSFSQPPVIDPPTWYRSEGSKEEFCHPAQQISLENPTESGSPREGQENSEYIKVQESLELDQAWGITHQKLVEPAPVWLGTLLRVSLLTT